MLTFVRHSGISALCPYPDRLLLRSIIGHGEPLYECPPNHLGASGYIRLPAPPVIDRIYHFSRQSERESFGIFLRRRHQYYHFDVDIIIV